MHTGKANKSYLPVKTCVVCQRPFTWRKKWEKVWDEVRYCSEQCKRNKTQTSTGLQTPTT